MALERILGETLKLIQFPSAGLADVLPNFANASFREWEFLVANIAEFAISTQAKPATLIPYTVNEDMANYIAHKSNTLTYTCPPPPVGLVKSEYIFLFSSDCWKLREILRQEEPSKLLLAKPDEVARKIMQANWRFLPAIGSSHSSVLETVLLWTAKTIILTEPELDEDSLYGKVRKAAQTIGVAEKAPPAVAFASQ